MNTSSEQILANRLINTIWCCEEDPQILHCILPGKTDPTIRSSVSAALYGIGFKLPVSFSAVPPNAVKVEINRADYEACIRPRKSEAVLAR